MKLIELIGKKAICAIVQKTEKRLNLDKSIDDKNASSQKIRINLHGMELPESHGEWIDLRTAEDVVLEPLEFKIISLGVAMELPKGYYAHIVPRSSTCKNWGILMANSMGVIENRYNCNDDIWGFPAVAIRHTEIPKGTRICQFRLVKCAVGVEFDPVDDLGNENRGGWGSTGAV